MTCTADRWWMAFVFGAVAATGIWMLRDSSLSTGAALTAGLLTGVVTWPLEGFVKKWFGSVIDELDVDGPVMTTIGATVSVALGHAVMWTALAAIGLTR